MAAKKSQGANAPKPTVETTPDVDADVEARLAELEAEARADAAASAAAAEPAPAAPEPTISIEVESDQEASEPEPFRPAETSAAVEDDEASHPTPSVEPTQRRDPRETGAAARKGLTDAVGKVVSMFDGVAPGHSNTIIFGIIGVIAALLLFSVGFWRMIVLVLFILVGVAIGESLDGDPRIINMVKGFFNSKK